MRPLRCLAVLLSCLAIVGCEVGGSAPTESVDQATEGPIATRGAGEADVLEPYVEAVEARIQTLQGEPEEVDEDMRVAAHKMLREAERQVRRTRQRIASLQTAAGTRADRAKERALRRLERLEGRLDRARATL